MTFLKGKKQEINKEKKWQGEKKREKGREKFYPHGEAKDAILIATKHHLCLHNWWKGHREPRKIKGRPKLRLIESLPRPRMTLQKWRRSRRVPLAKLSRKWREESTRLREKEERHIEWKSEWDWERVEQEWEENKGWGRRGCHVSRGGGEEKQALTSKPSKQCHIKGFKRLNETWCRLALYMHGLDPFSVSLGPKLFKPFHTIIQNP